MDISVFTTVPRSLLRPMSRQQIHLWCWNMVQFVGVPLDNAAWLSESERQIAAQLDRREERRRYVTSHCLVRYLLSLYLKLEPADIPMIHVEQGQYRIEASDLCVDFAICDEVIMIAVARDIQIGVSIEAIHPIPHLASFARYTLSPTEMTHFSELDEPAQLKYVHALWSSKSALFKMTKMQARFDQVTVSDLPDTTLHIRRFNFESRYYGSLAYRLDV